MGLKVTVVGAAGGIGQPLSLLLKQSTAITELALYDVVPVVVGVASDISHVDTPSVVTGHHKDDDGLKKALTGAQIVVIPAGVPRKPGMTRDDLFNTNASIVRDIATAAAQHCPKAFLCIISNPVNSTVPITAEVLKKSNVFDPARVFGVTTLDVVRASTMSAQAIDQPQRSSEFKVPVIGGHAGVTILPLLSQAKPALPSDFLNNKEKVDALVKRIQFGGDEVVAAKAGAGSATLSMAYAGFKFVESLIAAAHEGKSGVREYAYINIKSDIPGAAAIGKEIGSDIEFFSVPVELGPNGVAKVHPIGSLNDNEAALLKAAVPELEGSIKKGVSFVGAKL